MLKPRQGYLLVAQVKSPYGEKAKGIDISPVHDASICEWNFVLAVWEPRTVDGKTFASDYVVGALVYNRKGAADAVLVEEGRVLGLLHESQIKGTESLPASQVQFVDVNAQIILDDMEMQRSAMARAATKPNGSPLVDLAGRNLG